MEAPGAHRRAVGPTRQATLQVGLDGHGQQRRQPCAEAVASNNNLPVWKLSHCLGEDPFERSRDIERVSWRQSGFDIGAAE